MTLSPGGGATAPPSATARRRIVPVVLGALTAASVSVVVAQGLASVSLAGPCGPGGDLIAVAGGPPVCAHSDQTPPGVDVTERVSTEELRTRPGAGPAAYAAAEQLGVPVAAQSTATSPDVACDGDGRSGYRVQAMYVVESGRSNRYAALLPSFQRWAAGVDDVFNRSAALTGGVRRLRYVTEPGGGGCVAQVLNVTVPAGSMSSFGATISAVQALGHTDPARKYLMWTDASVLCGVASMYPNDSPAQTNPNNGSYPQYARVDSGCWGLGNGTSQISVEAHEVAHALGGVQSTAPHGTRAGHCWDEADTMCYADGGGFAMRQLCPADREYLLDCNSDDYFSTYPDPGSYLDTRWNSASSRFLIGGGDGTGGGTTGSPTVLGASIAVNNPAVPGLSTQVSVAPAVPQGRTLTSVRWRSARADCTFATPDQVQSTVQCAASASAPTTVTATLTDSTGATKTVTSPLTFATGTSRPVTLGLSVAGQATAPQLCTGAASPVVATVRDAATGQPVKGLTALFSRQTAAMAAPASAGSVASTTGGAAVTQTATLPTTYGVSTNATAVYAAGARAELAAEVGRCMPTLTAAADTLEPFHGDRVTLTGTLTRVTPSGSVAVSGAVVPVTLTVRTTSATGVVSSRVYQLGTARTDATGAYRTQVRPTLSGALAVGLGSSAAYAPTTAALGDVVVRLPQTSLTASADRTDVAYGGVVVVTGTLTRTAGISTAGVAGQIVTVRVAAPGRTPTVAGTGRTLADGSYRVPATLRTAGDLSATFAGAAGLPAAARDLGPATVGTWTAALASSAAPAVVAAGQAATLTGTLTRSYAGVTEPARWVPVKVYSRADGATTVSTLSVSTTSTGGFTVRVFPRTSTTYTVSLVSVAGYDDTAAPPLRVEVR